MLAKRIIPCLDVNKGRVVKGVNFVNLIDAGDPVEAAKAYDEAGADELVFLDITASAEDRDIIFDVVKETAETVFMPLTVGGGWEVYIHGGRTPTGIDAVEWAKAVEDLGAGEILLTSMDRDGTKNGYDIPLTKAVSEAVSIPVIASGGAGNKHHFYQAFTEGKADAALAASLFHIS